MSGGRGQYDRAAARARREAALAADGLVVETDHRPQEPVVADAGHLPVRIRLLEAHGFVDEIGAVYGPKPVGYETINPREIAKLLERGVLHEVT